MKGSKPKQIPLAQPSPARAFVGATLPTAQIAQRVANKMSAPDFHGRVQQKNLMDNRRAFRLRHMQHDPTKGFLADSRRGKRSNRSSRSSYRRQRPGCSYHNRLRKVA